MKEKIQFLFLVDVSGSMYGQKIASVNAVLSECLAEIKQIAFMGDYDIRIGILTFADSMRWYKVNETPESIVAPNIKVEPKEDGFYPITSFRILYKGIQQILSSGKVSDDKEGKNTFMFLFSDMKPVDDAEYEEVFTGLQKHSVFGHTTRYAVYVDENEDIYNKETIRFVNCKAERVLRMTEIPREISQLQMTFFAGLSGNGMNDEFDDIFV